MMKYILIMVNVVCVFAAAAQTKPFIIKGQLDNEKTGKIALVYNVEGKQQEDSAFLQNGAFELKGTIAFPISARLFLFPLKKESGPAATGKNMQWDIQKLYLDPGTITVNGTSSIENAVIKGGKTQAEYELLKDDLQSVDAKSKLLGKEYEKANSEKDEEGVKRIKLQFEGVGKEKEKVEDGFIKAHPDSYVNLDILKQRSIFIELPEFDVVYKAMSSKLRNTSIGKYLADLITIAQKLEIGRPAPGFTQNDTTGTPVSLSNYKGKYVLVDFWASWCVPCRAENPNVLKAYEQYKNKGFEIIGVSIDSKKEAWIEAIKKDQLTWINIIDLKGGQNEVAVQYGIKAVPQNFLLDKDGKIIAKNLRAEDLLKKLEEILN